MDIIRTYSRRDLVRGLNDSQFEFCAGTYGIQAVLLLIRELSFHKEKTHEEGEPSGRSRFIAYLQS